MITKKLWNTLPLSAKKNILTVIYGENCSNLSSIKKLLYEYKHDFDFDETGRKLKSVLSQCYTTGESNVINVRVNVKFNKADKVLFLQKETPKKEERPKTWYDYPYRGRHYVCDCEHMGDIEHEEARIREAGGIVDSYEWDGHDCGEAYIYYHCDSKKELQKVQQVVHDLYDI